eukprot:1147519-Pelagomonas_calceolata.AAC.4
MEWKDSVRQQQFNHPATQQYQARKAVKGSCNGIQTFRIILGGELHVLLQLSCPHRQAFIPQHKMLLALMF